LDRTTVAVLRRHRHQQQAEVAARGTDDGGYVFTNVGGRPISPDRLSIDFGELIAASGLPPVRLHDLRHGAASLALQAGADLKVVQDQLGHSSIVLTADTLRDGATRGRLQERGKRQPPRPQRRTPRARFTTPTQANYTTHGEAECS
jgi:integrase